MRCEVVHLLVIVTLSGVYPIPEILFSILSANNIFLHLHIEKESWVLEVLKTQTLKRESAEVKDQVLEVLKG